MEVWKDRFYVLTNEGAPRYRIFSVDPKRLERNAWTEIVREDPEAVLNEHAIVGGHLALNYLRNASTELELRALDGKNKRSLKLPALGTASNLLGNEDEDTAYFSFSSYAHPDEIYRTSIKSGKTERWWKVEVPIDPSRFVVERLEFPSKDGTRVSMFIVHAKDMVKDAARPTLLYGYGGFNVSLTPQFAATIVPWLESGGIYAVVHLRGGGEYGEAWHEGGMLSKKQNVFDDFIAAAEFLIRERYTRSDRLAIRGGSNGGLLVGAAMTQRPELFGAVVCAVPLLDMLRYPLFGAGKAWIPEYGDPALEADFRTLYAYSPYHRVRAGTSYPALLLESADSDDRVDPMHARKFAAAIGAATSSREPVLLRIESKAGHGGADMITKTAERAADELAFLLDTVADRALPNATAESRQ